MERLRNHHMPDPNTEIVGLDPAPVQKSRLLENRSKIPYGGLRGPLYDVLQSKVKPVNDLKSPYTGPSEVIPLITAEQKVLSEEEKAERESRLKPYRTTLDSLGRVLPGTNPHFTNYFITRIEDSLINFPPETNMEGFTGELKKLSESLNENGQPGNALIYAALSKFSALSGKKE
jgi:hypothetical protein